MRDNEVEVIIKVKVRNSMKVIFIYLFELYLVVFLKLKQRYVDGKKDRQQVW